MYFSWEVYLDSKFVAGFIYLYHIFCLQTNYFIVFQIRFELK